MQTTINFKFIVTKCFCTFIYVLVCMFLHMNVEASDKPQVPFLMCRPPGFSRQDLSLAWRSPSRPGWLAREAQDLPISTSPALRFKVCASRPDILNMCSRDQSQVLVLIWQGFYQWNHRYFFKKQQKISW